MAALYDWTPQGDDEAPTGRDAPSVVSAIPARHVAGVLVLTPQGALDLEVMTHLAEVVAGASEPVVIEMDDCLLNDPAVLEHLDPARWGRASDEVCAACGRYSGRMLLVRAGVSRRMAVFQRSEDAVQARVLRDAGYGEGWASR